MTANADPGDEDDGFGEYREWLARVGLPLFLAAGVDLSVEELRRRLRLPPLPPVTFRDVTP